MSEEAKRYFAGQCQALRRYGSQERFAKRFGLTAGAVRDLEQGRVLPSRAMVVLLHAIRMQPEFMERAAIEARDDLALLRSARN